MFRDRRLARVTLTAAAFAGLAVPAAVVVVRAFAGAARPAEVFVGALVGTLFFAMTGIVAAVYGSDPALKTALTYSYVFKMVVLLGVALLFPTAGVDKGAFAAGLASAAVAYVSVQALLLGRLSALERADDVVD